MASSISAFLARFVNGFRRTASKRTQHQQRRYLKIRIQHSLIYKQPGLLTILLKSIADTNTDTDTFVYDFSTTGDIRRRISGNTAVRYTAETSHCKKLSCAGISHIGTMSSPSLQQAPRTRNIVRALRGLECNLVHDELPGQLPPGPGHLRLLQSAWSHPE
jgi:uncharacterized protein YsxB (DUF464 family)